MKALTKATIMTDIETKNLRETFYKFFFKDYKQFVTGNMQFGVYIPKNKIETFAYENPYNLILMKHGLVSEEGKLKIKESNTDMKLPNNLSFSDGELANSVDCFFKICSTKSAKNHIKKLFSYNTEGGTKADEKSILVEDELLRLILDYFWIKIGKEKFVVTTNNINHDRDTFMKKVNGGVFHYSDVIEATRQLLGIDKNETRYQKIINFLKCVKELRNKAAHPGEGRIQIDYYDATIVNQFTLYALLATVLYLQQLLQINEQHSIELHVICKDKVTLYEGKNDVSGRNETNGWVFPIMRYHKYTISIPGKYEKEFEPKWFSQSPTVFCKETWDYVDNEFEMDCIMRNVTYANIQ